MKAITNEIKEAILNVTGENRADCINKVAEKLNADVGEHTVFVRNTRNIKWNGLVIDLTTRKIKGVQTVVNFFAWEEGNKNKTIEMFTKETKVTKKEVTPEEAIVNGFKEMGKEVFEMHKESGAYSVTVKGEALARTVHTLTLVQ